VVRVIKKCKTVRSAAPTPAGEESIARQIFGALNFSSNGSILNPEVGDAIVAVINLDVSVIDLAAILKNAFDHGYQEELNQLVRMRCKEFSFENYCATHELVGELLNQNLKLSIDDDGEFSVAAAAAREFEREELFGETDKVMRLFNMPAVIVQMVNQYHSAIPITFTEEHLQTYLDIFSRSGNRSFKRMFIETALSQGQLSYINRLFGQIRTGLHSCPRSGSSVSVVNLEAVDLSNLDLSHVDFERANLNRITMHNSTFAGCQFFGSTFQNAHLSGGSLSGAKVTSINIAGAILSGEFKGFPGDFFETTLSGATLDFESESRIVRFYSCVLTNVSLVAADNICCYFSDATVNDVDLTGAAKLMGFQGCTLTRVNLSNRKITDREGCDPKFAGATLIDVNLSGANLAGLNLTNTILVNVSIRAAATIQGMIVSAKTMEGLAFGERLYLHACIATGRVIKREPELSDD